MVGENIHEFSMKWFDKFKDMKTTSADLCRDFSFADDCEAFGFQMDCGEAFMATYPDQNVIFDYQALSEIIDTVEDISLLGSALFSRWYFSHHCVQDTEEITTLENRSWFLTALERLERLTSESETSEFLFEGVLQKAKLVSNSICFGTLPQPDEEVEQLLTISDDGALCFCTYVYGNGSRYTKISERKMHLDSGTTSYLLKKLEDHFSNEFETVLAKDVGMWQLLLTNTDGEEFTFRGSLVCMDNALDDISDTFRKILEMPELSLFDGAAHSDRLERIIIDYHRSTKINPKKKRKGITWEFATWNYTEQIVIDRKTETLKHRQNIGTGCTVERSYHVKGGIENLLDGYDTDIFLYHIQGYPEDIVKNQMETKDYTITLDFLYGEQRIVSGSFDKNGLPDDFPDLAESIVSFMQFYGMGEILNPLIYKRTRRRQTDFIFCNVTFEEFGKEYCYLTDDDTLEEGDFVMVPAGRDNHLAIVRIESIEYHPESEAPFPLDKIKKIIRKCTEDDFN